LPQSVRLAQVQTTGTIVQMLESFLDVPWSWAPVIQGRTLEDYLIHAIELPDILYQLRAVYCATRKDLSRRDRLDLSPRTGVERRSELPGHVN
jgi:hypothetical protein